MASDTFKKYFIVIFVLTFCICTNTMAQISSITESTFENRTTFSIPNLTPFLAFGFLLLALYTNLNKPYLCNLHLTHVRFKI